MIRAALHGNPGMIPAFLVLALLLAAAGHRLARRHGLPRRAVLLLAVALAGEVAVTLYPTFSGGAPDPSCAWSGDPGLAFRTEQGRLNLLMYLPIGLSAVLALGRPLAAACGVLALSATTETVQGLLPAIGRACDSADFTVNATGGLLGVLLGCAVRLVRRRRIAPDRREWRLTGLLVAAAGVPVLLLQSFVLTPTAATGAVEVSAEQERLARQDTALLFGPDARLIRTQRLLDAGADRLTATVDRGFFTVDWPSGRLRDLITFPADPGAAPPAVPAEQAAASARGVRPAADAFAVRWLPDLAPGTEPVVTPGGGQDGSHRFTYGTGPDAFSLDVAPDGRPVRFGIRR
ncbi:VanZ family protein [Kitasatospora sp. NPDC088783]|uniref:VanZ family protein n=1 Tax=Kitasatospora sp. NPDC088783 TaxID=3364077 RepID=UPI0037FE1962